MWREEHAAVWSARIAEQAGSGLSVVAFCVQRGLSEKTFYKWRQRLGGGQLTPSPGIAPTGLQVAHQSLAETVTKLAATAQFVPVSVVRSATVEIELACGATIRLSASDRDQLHQVLSVLVELGRSQCSVHCMA